MIPHHFTASGIVIHEAHILLIEHRRIGAWLPPGGHIEPFELPHQAAIREIEEETGLVVQVISDAVPQTAGPDAVFLELPLCLHRVKAHENGHDVYHLDLAYLCRPTLPPPGDEPGQLALPTLVSSAEVLAARWVPLKELSSWRLALNVEEAVQVALAKLDALGAPLGSFSSGLAAAPIG